MSAGAGAGDTRGPGAVVGDEGQLYRALQPRLLGVLRRTIRAPEQLLEDACSFAWVQLVAHQPDRDGVLRWLAVVARHEALRLIALDRRVPAIPLHGDEPPDAGAPGRAAGATVGEDLASRAHEALEALASLPARQRRLLALKVAGFSYREIMAIERCSYTAVNRHLARARDAIRAAEGGGGG